MPPLDHVFGLGAVEVGQSQIEPEQLMRQIHFAVRTLFERRLARAPILLVVEDLHWADAASLEVLRLLADRLDRSRLMMVLTHRPVFEAGALATSRTNQCCDPAAAPEDSIEPCADQCSVRRLPSPAGTERADCRARERQPALP
jgi:hypothetical protein